MLNKIRTRLIPVATIGSIGLVYYLFNNNNLLNEYKNTKIIEDLQSKSTLLTITNFQIQKNFGPVLTTTLEKQTILEELNKNKNTLSFHMTIKKGKDLDYLDDYFAELLINSSIQNLKWNIDTIDIKFRNSNSKSYLKLYESIRMNESIVKSFLNNEKYCEKIFNSSYLEESSEYLRNLTKLQPFILESIELLLNDKQKLNNLGPPIKLISHDIFHHQNERINVKMRIEGKKRNADMILDAEKFYLAKDQWNILFLGLMYEINEDFMLSSSDLAKKYTKNITESLENRNNEDLVRLLNEINLTKTIEDKLLNNSRVMDTIGRPIEITIDQNDKFNLFNETSAKIKVNVTGKLNNGELILTGSRSNDKQSWTLSKSEMKIIWNTKSNTKKADDMKKK